MITSLLLLGRSFQQPGPRLFQPFFRVLRRTLFPELEMQLVLTGNGVDGPDDLAGPDLFPGLHGYGFQLAVEGEIGAVLDEHALVVTRHYDYLDNGSVEHRLHLVAAAVADAQQGHVDEDCGDRLAQLSHEGIESVACRFIVQAEGHAIIVDCVRGQRPDQQEDKRGSDSGHQAGGEVQPHGRDAEEGQHEEREIEHRREQDAGHARADHGDIRTEIPIKRLVRRYTAFERPNGAHFLLHLHKKV